MKKACFFSTEGLESIRKQQYSIQDINILTELEYKVEIASSFFEIPWNADLYYSWWASGSILPLIVAKITRKPIIVIAGGNEALLYRDSLTNRPGGYLASPWYKKVAVRIVLRFADKVVVVSRFMQQGIKRLSSREVTVVYNSVDIDKFSIANKKRKYITSVFNFNERVFALKRGKIFLEAIPFVLKQYPEQKFLIVCSSIEGIDDVQTLIDQLNIRHAVTIRTGVQNQNMPDIFSQSIAYVQISDTETFGMSVVEAMSTGTPVVVSERGALPEVVGECGVYVDHNNSESTAIGIMKILENKTALLLKNCARDRVVHNFSYNRRLAEIKNVINKMNGIIR